MESGLQMYREQLVTLLTKYKPDQLRKVDEMLLKYAGREEALLMALRERYNVPEPLPIREMQTSKREEDSKSNNNNNNNINAHVKNTSHTITTDYTEHNEVVQNSHKAQTEETKEKVDNNNSSNTSKKVDNNNNSTTIPFIEENSNNKVIESTEQLSNIVRGDDDNNNNSNNQNKKINSNKEVSENNNNKTTNDELSQLFTEKLLVENSEEIHSPRSLQTPLSSVSLSTSNVNFSDNRKQPSSAPRNYRQELIDLYTQYDAAHLYKVDQYLSKYKGREAAMVAAIRKKLCATSPIAASASQDNLLDRESVNDKEAEHDRSQESALPVLPVYELKQENSVKADLQIVTNTKKDMLRTKERADNETKLIKGNIEPVVIEEQIEKGKVFTGNDDDDLEQGSIQECDNVEPEQAHNFREKRQEENNLQENMYDDTNVEDVEPVNIVKNLEDYEEISTEKDAEKVKQSTIDNNNINNSKVKNIDKIQIQYEEQEKQGQSKSHKQQQLLENDDEVNDKYATVSDVNKETGEVQLSENINIIENNNDKTSLHPNFPVLPDAQKQTMNILFARPIDDNENTCTAKSVISKKEEELEKEQEKTYANDSSPAKKNKVNIISGLPFTLLEQYFTSLGVMQINELPHIDKLCCIFLLENLVNESEEGENDKTCGEVISELHLPAFVTFRQFCQAVNVMRTSYALGVENIINNIKRHLCDVTKMNAKLHNNAMQRESNKRENGKDNNCMYTQSAAQANTFTGSKRRTKPASLSTSVAVIRNRHKCISEEFFSIKDLQYGFTVYRSIRPSVSESWVQCWGNVTSDARFTCTQPRSTSVEINIPFEHIVECKLQSFVAHSYYSSSGSCSNNYISNNIVISDHLRYSALPPSMAKNGVCVTLTRDAIPLQLWLCTTSMFISQAIVRCFRAWQRQQIQYNNIVSMASRNANLQYTTNGPLSKFVDYHNNIYNSNNNVTINSDAKKKTCNDKQENVIDYKEHADAAIRDGFAFANTPLHERHPMTDKLQSPLNSCNIVTGATKIKTPNLCSYGTKMFTRENNETKIVVSDALELSALHVWAACGGSAQFQHEKWAICGSHLLFEIVNDIDVHTQSTNKKERRISDDINNISSPTSLVYAWSLHEIDDIVYNDTSPISASQRSSTTPLTSMLKLSFHHAALSIIRKPVSFETRQESKNCINITDNTVSYNKNIKVKHHDKYETTRQLIQNKASNTRNISDARYLVIRCKTGYTLFCACATLAERNELVQWLSHALIRIALHIASPEPLEMHLAHRIPGTLPTSREHWSRQELEQFRS